MYSHLMEILWSNLFREWCDISNLKINDEGIVSNINYTATLSTLSHVTFHCLEINRITLFNTNQFVSKITTSK